MYEEIQLKYPLEFALRDQDKYRYRYPKGEVSLHELCFLEIVSAFHFNLNHRGLMAIFVIGEMYFSFRILSFSVCIALLYPFGDKELFLTLQHIKHSSNKCCWLLGSLLFMTKYSQTE